VCIHIFKYVYLCMYVSHAPSHTTQTYTYAHIIQANTCNIVHISTYMLLCISVMQSRCSCVAVVLQLCCSCVAVVLQCAYMQYRTYKHLRRCYTSTTQTQTQTQTHTQTQTQTYAQTQMQTQTQTQTHRNTPPPHPQISVIMIYMGNRNLIHRCR